ncbi:MAG: 5'-nucleotidase C-terminal domain-containing protein [Lachnospiraceae bacterium]|nr:5'-nucleotidase C-terminal domain-containing protein [Lachnospiraceae bacterium]
MKNKNVMIGMTAAAMAALTLSGMPVMAQDAEGAVDIQILATSDLHGKFDPYDYAVNEESTSGSMAQIQSAVKELRTDNTILLDVGDTIQGNSADLFLEDEVHPMAIGMNLMNYDVWVPGNHEFNYGVDVLKKIMGEQKAAVLCGNVYNADGSSLSDGYTIIEKDGVKVAVIGMVTPNITRWDAANLAEYNVTDPVEETKKIIDEVKDDVDVIVAAEHMGESNEYEVADSGVEDLANACPEIDVIVAAHEHKLVEGTEVNGVLIVENQDAGKTLAQVNLTVEKDENGEYEVTNKTSASIAAADYEADEEFTAALADADARAKEDANTVIGTLNNGPLAPENEIEGIAQAKLQETALIDLINEVQMYYTDADVSASALFVDSANLQSGDIRKCDLALIYKYANTLYKVQMTGKQLKQYMEWSASYYNTYKDGDLTISFNPDIAGFNYDMFSGINYEVNIANEAGSRIENVTRADGSELKDDDVITLAVNNYRANSQLLSYGEIYKEGEDLPVLLEMDVKGEIGGVRELIGDYIANVKGGTLDAPELAGNWRVTGNDWDADLHTQVAELINTGKIALPASESGRNTNVKSITVDDVKSAQ